MQVEASVAKVVGGCGQFSKQPKRTLQSAHHAGSSGSEEEEAHLDRDHGQGGAGEGFHPKSETYVRRDLNPCGELEHGEGSYSRVVSNHIHMSTSELIS